MESAALRDLLVTWAHLNSGSDHVAGLARMRATLEEMFREKLPGAVISAIHLPGTDAKALSVRMRPTAPVQVLLSGHYDTVYGAEHPFQRCEQIDEKILRGPGVADMKGGIVVMLAALAGFEQTPEREKLGWEVLLTPDEETGSTASRDALREAAQRHQLGLVFEPAREDGSLVRSRMGTGVFTITCRGRAAHAASPRREGRNAIVALAEFLVSAERIQNEIPGVLLNVGHIAGGGALNIVPDRAIAGINIRVARTSAVAAVQDALAALADAVNRREGFSLEITGGFDRPPLEPDARTEEAFAAWNDAARECGVALPGWLDVGGGSDANLLAEAGLPCLDGLGPVGGKLHSPDEYIELPSLGERARIATAFLTRLAQRGRAFA